MKRRGTGESHSCTVSLTGLTVISRWWCFVGVLLAWPPVSVGVGGLSVRVVTIGIPETAAAQSQLVLAVRVENNVPSAVAGGGVFVDELTILVSGRSTEGVVKPIYREVVPLRARLTGNRQVAIDVAAVLRLQPGWQPWQVRVTSAKTAREAVVGIQVEPVQGPWGGLLGGPWISRLAAGGVPFVRLGLAAGLLPLAPVSQLVFGHKERLRVAAFVPLVAGGGREQPYVAVSVRSAASGRVVLVPETRCRPERSLISVLSCAALLDWPSDLSVGRYAVRVSVSSGGVEAHRELVVELR